MRVFFDSSAFAKRYVREAGTDLVLAWCDRATEIGLASIALPEIISAFCRLRREAKITQDQYRLLKQSLLTDIKDTIICDLTAGVIQQSIVSLESNALRGMDAIHIGCAVALEVDTFVSADLRQCQAATRAGLKVDHVQVSGIE